MKENWLNTCVLFPGGRVVARYNVYRASGAQAALLQHERHVRTLPHRAKRLAHITGNYHLRVPLNLPKSQTILKF